MVQRVGGLISGLDTDSLIKALTLAQQAKIDKLKQQNTTGTWQQTEYRTIISKLNDFQNKYFSASNPLTNLTSASSITQYISSITNSAGASSSAVSVSVSGSVKNTAHSISVEQLAQKETWQGGAPVKLEGSGLDLAAVNTAAATADGYKFAVDVDGQTKVLTLKGNYADANELKVALQGELNKQFGENKVTVGTTADGSNLTFEAADGHFFGVGNVAGGEENITQLGFKNQTYTKLSLNTSLDQLNLASGNQIAQGSTVKFSINGKDFEFDSSATMQDIFNTVNNSGAGVRMYYSEINNAVVMESKNGGLANQVDWTDGDGGLMNSLFGAASSTEVRNDPTLEKNLIKTEAQDAIFTLDGMRTTRSSNTFEVEGITYTLNDVTTDENGKGGELKINLTQDTSKTKQLIMDFVKDYNELIKYVNDKIREEKVAGYDPLTDEQKAALTEYEIKEWETQAKTGLLRNDPLLRQALTGLSNSIFMSTGEGGAGSYSFGLMQSGSYSDGGQITLDMDQLDKALRENPGAVESFFTSSANGLAKNMSDVITRVASTDILNQGTLVQKAGVAGKSSEYFNDISAAARERSTQIQTLIEALTKKQNDLYARYAKMESAMNTMQQQLSALSGLG